MKRVDGGEDGFCWLDLAASDSEEARRFYSNVFGWTSIAAAANGGTFTRLLACGRDVASIYQLRASQLAAGVPSHWTPYFRVGSADATAQRMLASGARILCEPFDVERIARIALLQDPIGAVVGVLQPLPTIERENDQG